MCVPMQETQVRSLVWEDPTCHRATKPMHHNYWACTLEPEDHNYWAHMPQLPPCMRSRAWAPQQEKPAQREALASQLERRPRSPQLEKAHTATETQYAKNKEINKMTLKGDKSCC